MRMLSGVRLVELPLAADSCPCVVQAANRVTSNCWCQRQCVGVHLSTASTPPLLAREEPGIVLCSPATHGHGHGRGKGLLQGADVWCGVVW
jgi:hypothetical protein